MGSKIFRIWAAGRGGAGNGGGVEPLAPQDEPQEEDDGDQATVEFEEESSTVEWASEGEHEEDEEASASAARLQVEATTHTHIQDARIAAVQHPRPLAFVPTLTQISIDTVGRELPSSNPGDPGAEISNAIVSVGIGPQETLDRKLESRMGGDAGADGGA